MPTVRGRLVWELGADDAEARGHKILDGLGFTAEMRSAPLSKVVLKTANGSYYDAFAIKQSFWGHSYDQRAFHDAWAAIAKKL